MTQADVDALERALERVREGHRDYLVPARIVDLVTMATEVAEALAAPSLSAGDRARLLARIHQLAGSNRGRPDDGSRPLWRRSLVGELRRHPIAAGAGGAALTLAAAIAVSLLRDRSQREPAGPAMSAA